MILPLTPNISENQLRVYRIKEMVTRDFDDKYVQWVMSIDPSMQDKFTDSGVESTRSD